MCALCKRFYVVAPDLRGYGETEASPIDATRGMRDWSDDLHSFAQALGLDRPIHLVGWSLGGGVVMQYAIDHPGTIASRPSSAHCRHLASGAQRLRQETQSMTISRALAGALSMWTMSNAFERATAVQTMRTARAMS